MYFNLLILCGIFCQGIFGSFLEEKESSDLLVRKKRVLNYGPNRNNQVLMREHGYIVSIRENRRQHHCAGAILSFRIVITAAKCVPLPVTEYGITAGVSRFIQTHANHNMTSKNIHLSNDPHRSTDGIALFTVSPTFEFSQHVHSIGFRGELVMPGTLASVPGWGCNAHEHQPGWETSRQLGLITVPIISHEKCVNAYRGFFPIIDTDICTHDTSGKQYCGVTDQGAPLIVEGPGERFYLIGINLWGGSLLDYSRPDIYVNVLHPYYMSWIGLQV